MPISDTFAARVAFNTEQRNSFYHITGPWTGDPGPEWGSAASRPAVDSPTPQLSVLLKTDYNYLDNGGYFGDAITIRHRQGNRSTTCSTSPTTTRPTPVDQFVRSVLKSTTPCDNGIDPALDHRLPAGPHGLDGRHRRHQPPAPNYIIAERGGRDASGPQEFNLISPDQGPMTWVLGAYYNSNTLLTSRRAFHIGFPPGGVRRGPGRDQPDAHLRRLRPGELQPAGTGSSSRRACATRTGTPTTGRSTSCPEFAPLFNQPQNERYHGDN